MPAHKMFLLELGAEPIPKSLSVLGGGDRLIWEPIIGIVVDTGSGWVLLETGIGRKALSDEKALTAIYGSEHPWGLDGEPLVAALAGVDLSVDDIELAAASHLHIDHSGGLRLLAEAGIPVVIQREELRFGLERADLAVAYYRDDYVDVGVDWQPIEGDVEIAPGIQALATPGHTPGHMSYRVDLPETGTWLFTVDAADLGENIVDHAPPGSTAVAEDASRAVESLERLIAEAERLDARIVPGHDPVFWRAVRQPPGGHR